MEQWIRIKASGGKTLPLNVNVNGKAVGCTKALLEMVGKRVIGFHPNVGWKPMKVTEGEFFRLAYLRDLQVGENKMDATKVRDAYLEIKSEYDALDLVGAFREGDVNGLILEIDEPTPDEPTPDEPTPDEPTPEVPTPEVPTPEVPTPEVPPKRKRK